MARRNPVALAGVAVARVVVLADFNGRSAAVGDFALGVLELDRGVINPEPLPERAGDLLEDAPALRGRNVSDGDMAGQGMGLRTETPDMEIMHVFHPFDRLQGMTDLCDRNAARRALKQNIEGLAHIEIELHKMSAAIRRERTGSIQFSPVNRMAPPPTITAAVESVSPSM